MRRIQNSATINVMVSAAEKAGRKLTRDFNEVEHLQVSKKGPADFVSAADKAAEKIIVGELSKARPRYGFLLEEGGQIKGGDDCNRWIVDPLDGTTNFLHGLPHFAVSIALERDGEVIAGVIYDPARDELFWAEKGAGAFLNGRRLRASSRKKTEESLFATGIPFKGISGHSQFLRQLAAVMAISAGVRRFGSAALDLAYVAAGRYDGYWEKGIHPWDMAAGIVITREAGCLVSEIDGGGDMMKNQSILAANGNLHSPLSKILRDAAKD